MNAIYVDFVIGRSEVEEFSSMQTMGFRAKPAAVVDQALSEGGLDLLYDAWEQGGFGLGFTYHASLPIARIDAILHWGFQSEYAEVIKVSGSDHRGIYAALRLDEEQK